MYNRIRVIMTQEGMKAMQKSLTYGYFISYTRDRKYVRILEDYKNEIKTFNRNFWKAYHPEENY
jgi:hypothetical protein